MLAGKKYIVVALSFLFSAALIADEINAKDSNPHVNSNSIVTKKSVGKISASTTFTSKHMWRAFPSGNAPCIEPLVSYTYKGLSAYAWASYAIDNSYTEFDLFVKYTWKSLQVGLFDYYCPRPDTDNSYSDFSSMDTRHLYEVQLCYLGTKKFPLNIITGCFIGGFDRDENGDQLYSTYAEVNYTFSVEKTKLKPEIGMTPFKGMYAKEFSVFNYGFTVMRDIKVSDKWSIPSYYKLIYNKERDDVFFTVGFVFK